MLIKLKPNTPGQRGTVLVSKKHLSKESPFKPLTKPINKTGGRNNQGRRGGRGNPRRSAKGERLRHRIRIHIRVIYSNSSIRSSASLSTRTLFARRLSSIGRKLHPTATPSRPRQKHTLRRPRPLARPLKGRRGK